MKKLELTFISDPGHGWLQIEENILRDILKNKLKDISTYSYRKRGYWFLEEDCDAGILLEEAKAQGIEVELFDLYVDDFRDWLTNKFC